MLRRHAPNIALASMAALVLVGCTPDQPTDTTPPPTATSAGSDQLGEEDAASMSFVAAQAFYTLVDDAFASGELPEAALTTVATEAAVQKVESELAQFSSMGWTIEGSSTLDSPLLASWQQTSSDEGVAELLVCLDTSAVVTSDDDGQQVTGGDPRQPRLFTLEYDGSGMRVSDFGPVAESTELPGCGS